MNKYLFDIYEFYGIYDEETLLVGQVYTHVNTPKALEMWYLNYNPWRAERMAQQFNKYKYLRENWRPLVARDYKFALPGEVMIELLDKGIHYDDWFLRQMSKAQSQKDIAKAFVQKIRDNYDYYYEELCAKLGCNSMDELAEKLS